MSFQTTVDSINEMKAELERATAVTTVEKPDGTSESVPGEFSCERLELLLDEHVSAVTNVLDGKTAEIAAIMSKYAPILSIPSDPLKIIGWAKKVVLGMVDPQLSAAIKLATENNFASIMSHRSGETEDSFISDLAVASRCP